MKNRVLRRFADGVSQLDFGSLDVAFRDILFGVFYRSGGIFGVRARPREYGNGGGENHVAPWTTAATLAHCGPFPANHRHVLRPSWCCCIKSYSVGRVDPG